MTLKNILGKINRKWLKSRLQPIRVFVFHQVGEVYNPDLAWRCDWSQIEQFKQTVLSLKDKYEFISLTAASYKIKNNLFRRKRYAVLTSDDGWLSVLDIVPWIYEQQIPLTLFLNPAYLLKEECRESDRSNLLSIEDLNELINRYDNITIGSHGWNHKLCSELTMDEFMESIEKCEAFFTDIPNYIPFFAYPCGKHTDAMDEWLLNKDITPVYCDGQINYNSPVIHRECIDEQYLPVK